MVRIPDTDAVACPHCDVVTEGSLGGQIFDPATIRGEAAVRFDHKRKGIR